AVGARRPPIGERREQAAIGVELGETVIGKGYHLTRWDVGREGGIERTRIVRLVVDEAGAFGVCSPPPAPAPPSRPRAPPGRGECGTGKPESAHGGQVSKWSGVEKVESAGRASQNREAAWLRQCPPPPFTFPA